MNKHYQKIKNHVFLIRDFLLDLIFPINCPVCGQEGKYLCEKCEKEIDINQKLSCPHCKKENRQGSYCYDCQTNYQLDGLLVSGDYHNKVLSTLIKKFKYSFSQEAVPILAKVILNFLQKNNIKEKNFLFKNKKNTIIIPVPLHKKRQRQRGFNQSEFLALSLAKELNIDINTKNLKRHIATKSQAKLKRQERLKNVHKAFSWTGGSLHKKNIILIDDVASTGATLNNCAKPLKKAGAKNVWGLVLAKN